MVRRDATSGAELRVSMSLNGVLVVDKPQGPTSHDVVAEARRALQTRRIGHTGTLDPLATGVLPLVVGQATRLSQFLTGASKGYQATIRLGVATDTYDAEGTPTRTTPFEQVARISDSALADALEPFRGTFDQTPPPYSAKKIAGVRAYALARRQLEVRTEPVRITVSVLETVERRGDVVRLRIEASAGFYVRSLAHDLGERLGCGAHLDELRRYRSGPFTLDEALTIDELREGPDAAAGYLVPMERLLEDLPVVDLSDSGTIRARHGNALGPADARPRTGTVPSEGGLCRLFSGDGRLIAVARRSAGGSLQPVVVLG
jgi:tRNA pseudouridine55 synthase